jgi:hypothetical protein
MSGLRLSNAKAWLLMGVALGSRLSFARPALHEPVCIGSRGNAFYGRLGVAIALEGGALEAAPIDDPPYVLNDRPAALRRIRRGC